MALPRKTDIVETERVILNIPKGIYDVFMKELNARNERLKDNGDAAFFGPYAYELLTEDLKKERLDAEKEKKAAKDAKPGDKPHLVQPHQQSA